MNPARTAGRCAVVCAMLVLAAAAQDAQWLARNDRGNRYEGSTAQNVSAVELVELIGFHASLHQFDPRDNVKLYVTFYGAADPAKVLITARELVRREYYWMQAKPETIMRSGGWNDFGAWRVADVLRALGIGSDQLVVLVRLDGALCDYTLEWPIECVYFRDALPRKSKSSERC